VKLTSTIFKLLSKRLLTVLTGLRPFWFNTVFYEKAVALGLWRGTWFSIAFGFFMPVGLMLWLRLVEEPELIERFGPGYMAYRRNVPAFWPRLRDAGKFVQFLITGR
jgi:protein-S-isoprenylcysteine O-methyltransferase Ste14